jgi:hypothetical protein
MSDDDQVGRNRPPKSSQFSKGRSGNPGGRPRGRKNNRTVLREIAKERKPIRLGGAPREETNVGLLFLVLLKRSMEGNLTATRALEEFRRQLSPLDVEDQDGGYIVFPEPLTMEEFELHARAQQAVYEYVRKNDPL